MKILYVICLIWSLLFFATAFVGGILFMCVMLGGWVTLALAVLTFLSGCYLKWGMDNL